MIGCSPLLRSVTVVAALGAVTSRRTGLTLNETAEAGLPASQASSTRTSKGLRMRTLLRFRR